jgi:hypothetical protein
LYGKIQVTIEDFASLMRPFHNPNSDKVWRARQLPSLKAMAGGLLLFTCGHYTSGLGQCPP